MRGCALLSSCSKGLRHLVQVLTLSVFFLLPLLLCQLDFRQAFSLVRNGREWNWGTLPLTTWSLYVTFDITLPGLLRVLRVR